MSDETCTHPGCEDTEIVLHIGPRKEPYCIEHVDYGMGRAFGPLHAMLDAAQDQGVGVTDPEEPTDA